MLHLTSGVAGNHYGTPGVWLFGNEKLLIVSEVNGNKNYPFNHDEALEVNRWINFEIEQLSQDGQVAQIYFSYFLIDTFPLVHLPDQDEWKIGSQYLKHQSINS